MLLTLIQNQFNKIISITNTFVEQPRWRIKLTFAVFFLSLFFTFPALDSYEKFNKQWEHIENQSKNPFVMNDYESGSHASKLPFRLTPALSIRMLNLGKPGSIFLQYLSLFLFLIVLVFKGGKVIQDDVSLVFVVLAFSFSFVCSVIVSDSRGIFDGLAYFLILLTLLSTSFFSVMIFQFLASFTDERALIASSLVIIFFQLRKVNPTNVSIVKFLKPTIQTYGIIVSWVLYFAIRFYLHYAHGLETGTGRVLLIKEHFPILYIGLWTGLEGLWVIIGAAIIYLVHYKKYFILSSIIFCSSILVFVAIGVIDTTRSMAYLFPLFFIGFMILRNNESLKSIRYLCLISFIICLVPTIYVEGKNVIWHFHSFPLRLIGYYLN